MSRPPWYAEGLRFSCTRCGGCCTGEPGYVWVSRRELREIAQYLALPLEACRAMHARPHGRRILLRERSNGDCTFWDRDAGCRIYPVRPAQCRSYPFWPENLATEERWLIEAGHCPGIGRGRLFRAEEILRIRRGGLDADGGSGGPEPARGAAAPRSREASSPGRAYDSQSSAG